MKNEEAIKNLSTYMYYAMDDMPKQVGESISLAISILRNAGGEKMAEYRGTPNGKEPPVMTAAELLKLQERAKKYNATETNFQRHFGSAERAAAYLEEASDCDTCPVRCKLPLAPNQDCESILLDWLNAPAGDEE